ncbi:MAG: DUF1080 domain-containing protein [Opitutales bacterium]|nr:DUF1080 domain-containing protein [Opitutales bacterium]MBT5169266.1 DUF1080 domain-containing protein [Opitutales bacterium]
MDISRRRFIGNIVFPVGGMTLMPLLSLKAAGNYGSWIPLFNGKDLTGWRGVNGTSANWKVVNGLLVNTGRKKGNASWIAHERVFDNFELEVEFRFEVGCNGGVFFRTPLVEKSPAYLGNEIQIADMSDSGLQKKLTPDRHLGALYTVAPPAFDASKPPGEWHRMNVRCVGTRCRVSIENQVVQDVDLTSFSDEVKESHPGLLRKDGHIGLQSKEVRIEFRSVRIREAR